MHSSKSNILNLSDNYGKLPNPQLFAPSVERANSMPRYSSLPPERTGMFYSNQTRSPSPENFNRQFRRHVSTLPLINPNMMSNPYSQQQNHSFRSNSYGSNVRLPTVQPLTMVPGGSSPIQPKIFAPVSYKNMVGNYTPIPNPFFNPGGQQNFNIFRYNAELQARLERRQRKEEKEHDKILKYLEKQGDLLQQIAAKMNDNRDREEDDRILTEMMETDKLRALKFNSMFSSVSPVRVRRQDSQADSEQKTRLLGKREGVGGHLYQPFDYRDQESLLTKGLSQSNDYHHHPHKDGLQEETDHDDHNSQHHNHHYSPSGHQKHEEEADQNPTPRTDLENLDEGAEAFRAKLKLKPRKADEDDGPQETEGEAKDEEEGEENKGEGGEENPEDKVKEKPSIFKSVAKAKKKKKKKKKKVSSKDQE